MGFLLAAAHASAGQTAELRVPDSAIAGNPAAIATSGSGKATFYLSGPGTAVKEEVSLGQNIRLEARSLQGSGRYVAVLCSEVCHSAAFFVAPGKPDSISFLLHPSRVPTGENNAISGVALPFDAFHNLVLAPMTMTFQLGKAGSYSAPAHDGVAWFRSASGKLAGMMQVTVSAADVSANRVVQAVAADPCNLRIKGERNAKGILVETEPVRDCAGNPVSDGTIVTFTATTVDGKSTVDAPIKHGVARAEIIANGQASISAASGVVAGNQLVLGAKP